MGTQSAALDQKQTLGFVLVSFVPSDYLLLFFFSNLIYPELSINPTEQRSHVSLVEVEGGRGFLEKEASLL